MGDLSDKVCTILDYGYNLGLARRLAREFGLVNYFVPWKDTSPESVKLSIGTGYGDIVRVRHFADVINSTDLFVFPDIYDGDTQHDLIMRGKRVWGARKGDRLEYDRAHFIKLIEKLGLPVPDYEICEGIDELEAYLKKNENQWIKVNLRGDSETWQHTTWERTVRKMEALRHRYGPIGNDIIFTVVAHIDSTCEAAYDGFCVTSQEGKAQFPETGFLGYEKKNKCHILRAIPYDDFPDAVREVNDVFAPMLAKYWVRGGFGTEIKIVGEGKSQKNYFLDATVGRQPSPPGEIIMEMVTNLGEFFYEGAEGNMIPLEIEEPYGVQVSLYSDVSKSNFCPVVFPEEIDQWVKLCRACYRDDMNQIVPDKGVTVGSEGVERIGDVVAIAEDIETAIDLVKERCGMIEGDVDCEVDALADLIKVLKEGEEMGIDMGEVPEPATVLED